MLNSQVVAKLFLFACSKICHQLRVRAIIADIGRARLLVAHSQNVSRAIQASVQKSSQKYRSRSDLHCSEEKYLRQ